MVDFLCSLSVSVSLSVSLSLCLSVSPSVLYVGNVSIHKRALDTDIECSGECSLQNAMELSLRMLR